MSSSEKSEISAKQIQRERFKVLRSNKAFIIGSFILMFWIICAIFGQAIARYPINQMDFDATYAPPSAKYWFGTDQLGQDIFSRVIVGARLIVVISILATALGTAVGASIGLAAGYFKGIFDMIVMSPVITVFIIGFIFAPNIARTVRAAVLGEAELEYVAAARLRTERTPHILFREVLPNVLPPLIVEFTVRLGYAIFAVATLSFLGAGVETGSPDWGTQVAETWALIFSNTWWPTLFPALAIASLAVSINLISDALLEVFEI